MIKGQYNRKGPNLQVILLMEGDKVMGLSPLIMEHWKEILSMMKLMVKVNFYGKMEKFMKDSLKSLNFMALAKSYIQIRKLLRGNGDRIIT